MIEYSGKNCFLVPYQFRIFLLAMSLILFLLSGNSCKQQPLVPNSKKSEFETLQWTNSNKYIRAGRYLEYFFDPYNTATARNIIDNQKEYVFKKNQSEYASFGFINFNIWIKFTINNSTDTTEKILLEFANPQLRNLDIYVVQNEKILEQFKMGIHLAPKKRLFEHENYILPQQLLPDTKKTYLVRVRTDEAANVPVFVWSRSSFYRSDRLRTLAFGLFFGLIVAMALYNFFLYLTVKDITYLYYVLYLTFFCGFFISVYGYGILLLYSWVVVFYGKTAPFFSILTSIFALKFSRRFLLLNKSLPKLSRAIQIVLIGHYIGLVMIVLFGKPVPVLVGNIFPICSILILVPAAIIRVYQKFQPARYFLWAWSLLILGVSLYILQNFGLIRGNFVTQFGQLIGAAMEAVLLSFALGYRINDLQKTEEKTRIKAHEDQARALKLQQQMASSFERFVPRDFLKYLNRSRIIDIQHGDVVQKKMTVLFTDIRDFTSLSEKLGSQVIFELLNAYMGKMAPVVQKQGGFIDKFIGDAIMALFDDPASAVRASITMVNEMKDLASNQGLNDIELQTGFGIHYGELMLGTLGSPQRLETTVIGDTVNLSARIESVTKKYQTRIIVSDTVFRAVHDVPDIMIREIDSVYVKGKERPVVLFEVYNNDKEEIRNLKNMNQDLFMSGLAYFRSGEFSKARELFEQYQNKYAFDPIVSLYLSRLDNLEKDTDRKDTWTGIYDTWSA